MNGDTLVDASRELDPPPFSESVEVCRSPTFLMCKENTEVFLPQGSRLPPQELAASPLWAAKPQARVETQRDPLREPLGLMIQEADRDWELPMRPDSEGHAEGIRTLG